MVDEAKIHQFVGQMLSDLGGAASVALVRKGDALGLYKTLHTRGPMTVGELAAAAGVNERYLREWASHHAASNYLSYDPATQKFTLPEEQAMVFAIDDSPVNMLGAFDGIVAWLGNQEKVQPAFKNGGGVSWGDQTSCLFCAVARWRRRQAATGRQGRRCRMRPRLVHRADGQGIPKLSIHRLRLPSKLDRARAGSCER